MDTLPLAGRIAEFGREQHGLIARRQLVELDLTARQVRTAVSTCRLEPVLPNVFRLAGSPATPEQPFAAAVLWGGPDAVASFRSAASIWGIDVPEGTRPEITVWSTAHPRGSNVVAHRVRAAPDRRVRRNVPVTSPERTIIDLAGVLSARQLEVAFESARHQRLVTIDSVRCALDGLGARGRRGSAALQSLLVTLADEPPAESALEVLTARLLRTAALPAPQRQVEVVAHSKRYRLDFAWPEHSLALECDGRKWHDFEHDRRRWSAISSATGYRIVWATWARVRDEPEQLVEEIRRRVSRRGADRGAVIEPGAASAAG